LFVADHESVVVRGDVPDAGLPVNVTTGGVSGGKTTSCAVTNVLQTPTQSSTIVDDGSLGSRRLCDAVFACMTIF
jgi:hypothetical protein